MWWKNGESDGSSSESAVESEGEDDRAVPALQQLETRMHAALSSGQEEMKSISEFGREARSSRPRHQDDVLSSEIVASDEGSE